MEHFITEIKINKVRHLKDLTIFLSDTERKHLLLTGKNGSGKTSLLDAVAAYLESIHKGQFQNVEDRYSHCIAKAQQEIARSGGWDYDAQKNLSHYQMQLERFVQGIDLKVQGPSEVEELHANGDFVLAYYSAHRQNEMEIPTSVERIELANSYGMEDNPSVRFLKYMVHMRTQMLYSKSEGDIQHAEQIYQWFMRLESALQVLLEDSNIKLQYNYRQYHFQIIQEGRKPFGFNELSDGYSSVIRILSDLILRMDKNWLLGDQISTYDVEGIVLIDEVETHLHIELQRKILPFLTTFFPRVQFIVSTHSPYVLNSISNAVIYDLERRVSVEDLSGYLAEDVAEGYFMAPSYSAQLKKQVDRYRELTLLPELTDEERVERIELKTALKRVSGTLAPEIAREFQQIEEERRGNGSV